MIESETVAGIVSANVASVRKARQLTLDQLAKASGVSKGMVGQIEQGRSNPSIATLVRLANALGVTISRLVEPADGPIAKKVRVDAAITLWEGKAGGVGKLIAGVDSPALLEIWEWRLNPGEAHESIAHPKGARELLLVQDGALVVTAGSRTNRVDAGELLIFAGDTPHRYANEGSQPLMFLMITLEPAGQAEQTRRGLAS